MSLDLEAEYNNRARVPEHPGIIAGWKTDAAAYRQRAPHKADLAYGAHERQKLDLFLPEGPPRAYAMFIHGGYWQALDRSFFSHLAQGLNEHGFAVAVPSYRLCPEVNIADIVEDMRAAAAFLAGRFARPLIVAGHSAGGHLAACLLASDWRKHAPDLGFDPVPAAYAISGLFDLPPLIATSVNIACRMDQTVARAQSPLFWPAPAGKHIIAAVGADESSEYHRQSIELCERWSPAGVVAAYESVAAANHFTIIAPLADAESRMVRQMLALSRAAGLL